MANTLDDLMPKIISIGLVRLRKRLLMPRLVNTDLSNEAARRGATIDVPVPPTIAARAVVPGVNPVAAPDITETTVAVPLDQWFEAPIAFTDKDRLEAIDQSVEMAIEAAVDAIAEKVNESVFSRYIEVYEYVGTAGTTPFGSDYTIATAARKILARNKAPGANRRMVVNPDAEEKALNLGSFANTSFSSDNRPIIEGEIGRKIGFDWMMDQQVPNHDETAAGTILIDQADVAVGDKVVHLDGVTTVPVVGGVFTVAGDTQTYVVTSVGTLATTDLDIGFEPAAKVAWADDAAVTFKADHAVNLAFHRDAIALAIRPFRAPASDAKVMTLVDQVTGIPLRLEVSRQNKQDYWSFDLLWGRKVVRPDLIVRVAG